MGVLVVGGGITGLTATWALAREGVVVDLVEAGPGLGGKLVTERRDGFLIEAGPDSFLATRPAAIELCRDLGIADDLVGTSEPRTVWFRHRGRLVPMPEGLALVIPTRIMPFVRTSLFTPLEKLRMGLDLVLPRGSMDGDEGAGRMLRRRMGDALVERLAGPLVGGIYGTDIDEISLLAVVPQLREAERDHRSLTLAGLARRRAATRPEVPRPGGGGRLPSSIFLSLRGGMAELVEALTSDLARAPAEPTIRTSTSVASIERASPGFRARLSDGSEVLADAVVLATPAPATAELIEPLAPAAVDPLRRIRFGSSLVVTVAYRAADLPAPLAGHGFLIPETEGSELSASTFTSVKWPGRAPAGTALIRTFFRPPDATMFAASEDELVGRVRDELERLMGIRAEPILTHVGRWPGSMPRYTIGHLDRVAAIESAVAAVPGLYVAGASYRGVGVPECVATARTAARAVLELLARRRQEAAEPPPAPGRTPLAVRD